MRTPLPWQPPWPWRFDGRQGANIAGQIAAQDMFISAMGLVPWSSEPVVVTVTASTVVTVDPILVS